MAKGKSPSISAKKPKPKAKPVMTGRRLVKKGNLHILTKRRPRKDEQREERITMEVVVDAYNEIEQALGWYYYLEGKLSFPFIARCIEIRAISPLKKGNKVAVVDMAPEEECEHEMFVTIEWDEDELAVPLSQIKPVDVDEETREAIEDWHYWVQMGYEF